LKIRAGSAKLHVAISRRPADAIGRRLRAGAFKGVIRAMKIPYEVQRRLQAVVARMPRAVQFELRRANFARQIRRGRFVPDQPEMAEIAGRLRCGDWAVDVGANVGHYTCHMARCVTPAGRVLAFEPVPPSFGLLAANVRAAALTNVSLFNIALSSSAGTHSMSVPTYDDSALPNYYQARIASRGEYEVLCLPLDAIPIPGRVRLVKIDTEGHDLEVLRGMRALLENQRPTLIVEASLTGAIAEWLTARGYSLRKHPGSPNLVCEPHGVH
jgi:FkbM family methyltransferase